MLIEQQFKQFRALNEWFQTNLGMFVAQELTAELEHCKEYLRGETLLQLGSCGTNPWLNHLNFMHKWIASPFSIDKTTHIECELNHIPLARNSVDCILVPLSLEPFGSNMSLIDEIDRVVKPMGFVVFLSINPWSLWGGAMKCGALHCFNRLNINMRTSFSLNRIFLQRGYKQCMLSHFCYIPPINNSSVLKRLVFIEEIGRMVWPFPSGLYCYIAQKHHFIEPTKLITVVENPEYEPSLQPALNA